MGKLVRGLTAVAVAFAYAITGCSIAVDANGLSQGCPDGMKPCDGKCVSMQDIKYGCAGESCVACAFANARSTCNHNGMCDMGDCAYGFGDCNRTAADGCEVNVLESAANCLYCRRDCSANKPLTVSDVACGNGTCYAAHCIERTFDCDGIFTNGCEKTSDDLLQDPSNCGACGNACPMGSPCVAGQCQRCDGGTC